MNNAPKTFPRQLLLASMLAATVAVSGCWLDDDDNEEVPPGPPPVVVNEVPDSAGVSGTAFVTYLRGLSGSDDTSEPATLKETFAVPADDGSEPLPLT